MRSAALYDIHGNVNALEAVLAEVEPLDVDTKLTPDDVLVEAFGGNPLTVVGHTYVQFDRRAGGVRVVNAGSVGWPYEGTPGARWALLEGEVTLRTTAYDVAAAADAVRRSGFPSADDAAEQLLWPMSADAASEYFEQARGT